MNEIRREDPDAKLIHDISAVVERHGWPDIIEGFSIRLGEYDGDPATSITYRIRGEDAVPREGWEARGDLLDTLASAVSHRLSEVDPERQTYFRFHDGLA